ncbi:MAG: hypothetical protein AAB656_04145 [Patescibacteria group bacterium]
MNSKEAQQLTFIENNDPFPKKFVLPEESGVRTLSDAMDEVLEDIEARANLFVSFNNSR